MLDWFAKDSGFMAEVYCDDLGLLNVLISSADQVVKKRKGSCCAGGYPVATRSGARSIMLFSVVRLQKSAGITLIEILVAVAVVALLASIAVPTYQNMVDKADNARAAADISSIMHAIDRYYFKHHVYPVDLAAIGFAGKVDPWGYSYHYLRAADAGPGGAKLRKDKKLVPVNTDFDLYSVGKDGDSKLPFTARVSWDDIVRCNNGRYIGLAGDY